MVGPARARGQSSAEQWRESRSGANRKPLVAEQTENALIADRLRDRWPRGESRRDLYASPVVRHVRAHDERKSAELFPDALHQGRES